MAPLDRLFDDLSRRDRRVRFLSWLAVLLPATSGALLILSLTLHAFGVPFVAGPASGIILATVAVCASTVASAVVALRPVNLATLLYRLDAAVDGEARLSSLHEARKTGSSRFYEEALTPLVEERSSRYAMILRLTRGARLRVLLGLVLVALVAFSPWIGASLRPDRVASGPGSEGFLAAPPEVESEEELDETAEPDASEESAVGDEAVLDDVLESLRTSRTNPDDEVVEELPDAARLEEMQGDGPTTFVGFLFELSERIRNSGAAELSAEERSLISEILPEVEEELAADLEGLLNDPSADEAQERIERLLSADASFPEIDADALASDVSGNAESVGAFDPTDSSGDPTAPDGESVSPSDEEGGQGDAEGDATSREHDEEGIYPVTDFDGPEDEVPELVEAELPTEIGESGGVIEYITQGVPIEPPEGDSEDGPAYVVDFERMRSILDARTISADAYEIVQRYFEAITQGGT